MKNDPRTPTIANFFRTGFRRFLTGAYIGREEATRAFERQRARDAIGDRVMLWLACLGVAGLCGPTVVSELALAPLAVFFFVRTFNTFPTWIHWFGQPMFLVALAFAAWQATTLLWTRDLRLGLDELSETRWAVVGVLVWPIIHRRRTLLAALAVGFVMAHAAQVWQYADWKLGLHGPLYPPDPRRLSGWWDPVVGGSMLTAAVGLHLPGAVFGRGRTRWLATAGLLAALVGVLATGSRGAWLASGALVLGTLVFALARSRSRRALVAGAGGLVALGIGLAVLWGPVSSRVGQATAEIRDVAQGDRRSDIGRRVDMAEWAGRAIVARPVGGVGAGGYRAWVETREGPEVFDHAHNSVLHLGATTGLVGLGLWGLLVWVVMRNASIGVRRLGDPGGTSGPLFALLGFVLVSAFDVVHLNAQTAALMWLLAGMCPTWEPPGPENQG
ncbi:MAG: O-antigen ligase family protein [Phycisphaerales bacterium JB040]